MFYLWFGSVCYLNVVHWQDLRDRHPRGYILARKTLCQGSQWPKDLCPGPRSPYWGASTHGGLRKRRFGFQPRVPPPLREMRELRFLPWSSVSRRLFRILVSVGFSLFPFMTTLSVAKEECGEPGMRFQHWDTGPLRVGTYRIIFLKSVAFVCTPRGECFYLPHCSCSLSCLSLEMLVPAQWPDAGDGAPVAPGTRALGESARAGLTVPLALWCPGSRGPKHWLGAWLCCARIWALPVIGGASRRLRSRDGRKFCSHFSWMVLNGLWPIN